MVKKKMVKAKEKDLNKMTAENKEKGPKKEKKVEVEDTAETKEIMIVE